MPSLFRFLLVLGLLAALVYGGMVALVTFVRVEPRDITQTVALPKPSK
ncbi:MAG: histidine kinase [Roseiarcus sp.]